VFRLDQSTVGSKLSIVDISDLIKRKMLTSFNLGLRKHGDKRKAYLQALETLEREFSRFAISNNLVQIGLKAELMYYACCYSKHNLVPASAAGSHADFVGVIHGKPAAIDVTTNPRYKESNKFQELRKNQKQRYQYYVAVVSLKDQKIIHYPLLLPRAGDGGLTHFVLVMLYPLIEEFRLSCVDQFLIRYNPRADTDEKSVEAILGQYDYVVDYPPDAVHLYPINSIITQMNKCASFFERITNYELSAVVALDYDPDTSSSRMVTMSYWTHPDKYIQQSCGVPFSIMQHDVGTVLERKFRRSREKNARGHFEWRRTRFEKETHQRQE
jgi:hypothetical protein